MNEILKQTGSQNIAVQRKILENTAEKRGKVAYSSHPVIRSASKGQDAPAGEQIESILSTPRNIAYLTALKKGDEMTEADFQIVDMVQEHMEKQQEQTVGADNIDHFICSLSKCYICGCIVHTIGVNFIHYGDHEDGYYEKRISAMPERVKKGYHLYCQRPDCFCVEIYEKHLCVVDESGKTTVVAE